MYNDNKKDKLVMPDNNTILNFLNMAQVSHMSLVTWFDSTMDQICIGSDFQYAFCRQIYKICIKFQALLMFKSKLNSIAFLFWFNVL